MKSVYIIAVFFITLLVYITPGHAKSVNLVKEFKGRDVIADDGAHYIYLRNEGASPKISVEEHNASCLIELTLSKSKLIYKAKLNMETDREDGYNGCAVTIEQPTKKRTSVSFGYSIDF